MKLINLFRLFPGPCNSNLLINGHKNIPSVEQRRAVKKSRTGSEILFKWQVT